MANSNSISPTGSPFCSEFCSIVCLDARGGCLCCTKWIGCTQCLQKCLTNADLLSQTNCGAIRCQGGETTQHAIIFALDVSHIQKGTSFVSLKICFCNRASPQVHISELSSMKQESSVSKMRLHKVWMSLLFLVLWLHLHHYATGMPQAEASLKAAAPT